MPQKRGSFGECSMLWPAFFASAWAARALSPEPRAGTLADASALVQASSHVLLGRTGSRTTRVGDSEEARVTQAVVDSPNGPWVRTTLGPVTGIAEKNFTLFRGIPYVEPPKRFARAQPKQPWAPQTLNATKWGKSCIGSTSGDSFDTIEGENCLTANIWVAPGGRQNMPVIVYLHGGMNQHGSGREDLRHGDLIVQSSKMPVIYINFDFRLGIFGWIYGEQGSGVTNNLGFMDQQLLLQWVQRHISAFGGDPRKVTLMGQSEGATIILTHLVSPGSAGLFHRCVLASPPADVWSRTTNKDRTNFMIDRIGCKKEADQLACLKAKDAQELWGADWVSESLASPKSKGFLHNIMGMVGFGAMKGFDSTKALASQGWHPVVDGEAVPGEPRELIAQGRWNKVPILITTVKNESVGVLPELFKGSDSVLNTALKPLLGATGMTDAKKLYKESLKLSGMGSPDAFNLANQILTDKLWMCDIRAFVRDVVRSGVEARLGVFWHSPKFDRVGVRTNRKCIEGAACHATDMLYVLPQGRNKGIHGDGMDEEIAFSNRYSQDMLAFVHGHHVPWVPYDLTKEAVTFYDMAGPRVVEGYRKAQCDVLDKKNGEVLPSFMRRTSA